MNVQVKSGIAICIVGSAMFISGCGDDNVATGPSGRLTQGPVGGAVIFADNVSDGTRFVRDAGEIQTTTDATTGKFTLPSNPGYAYILVSVGGTDQLTNQPAMQLIAPSGSANVTPLTTLVALDTTGLVKAKIEALGTSFDVDLSLNATPAVLNLAKSVETVVAAMGATITSAGGTGVTATQLAAIKNQTMQSIALSLAGTAQDLSKPSALNTAMTTAVTAAITDINASNTNVTLPVGQAATIATNAVTACTTAVLGAAAVGSSTSASTTATVVENTVINNTTAATMTSAVTTTATVVSATTTADATPVHYTPPTIPVRTPPRGTGSTGSTGENF